jgi:hypothetical protein
MREERGMTSLQLLVHLLSVWLEQLWTVHADMKKVCTM